MLSEAFSLDFPLLIDRPFKGLAVLHDGPDEHPSAEFHRGKDGSIVYRDFKLNRSYTLPEVYHALKTETAPLLSDDNLRRKLLKQWIAELIYELNIYTQDALDYVKSLNKFIVETAKQGRMLKRFIRVWRVIANKMLRAYDHGGDIFTARWLTKEAGISDHLVANKALNLLVACGVLRESDGKVLKTGSTFIIEPVKDFDVYESLGILFLIHVGLKRMWGWSRFSRKAVYSILGSQVVKNIFTREKENEFVEDNEENQEKFMTRERQREETERNGLLFCHPLV